MASDHRYGHLHRLLPFASFSFRVILSGAGPVDGLNLFQLNEAILEQELNVKLRLHRMRILEGISRLQRTADLFAKEEQRISKSISQLPVPMDIEEMSLRTAFGGGAGQGKEMGHLNICNPSTLVQTHEKREGFLPLSSLVQFNPVEEVPPGLMRTATLENVMPQPVRSVVGYEEPRISDPVQQEERSSEGPGQEKSPKKEFDLILQPLDGSQNSFYAVTTKGAKLGRHSSNEIVVLEESVSRQHAEIRWERDKGQYFLRDQGSTTGTFIKVQSKFELKEGYIVELGSLQFLIVALDPSNMTVTLRVVDAPAPHAPTEYKLQTPIRVGRKPDNHLSYPDDLHLSNSHAEIFLHQQTFYLEDRASTNGTWLRLSSEGRKSGPYPLAEGIIFKVGTSSTYIVRRNNLGLVAHTKTIGENSLCVICCEDERDAVLLPCRHQVACMRCSKKLEQCPMCRVAITDMIKTYK
eukprot:TRINITY_DN1683_c0_g1_i11.p1 TRINITY_DN1683_c0_g1~~TRINITY_DN1683_c0_g1_i11.p1  ORF type:complete len:466 (+),score=48.88 TRINITY_DN1683_c0_g1_i11:221-1618(+)